VQGIIKKTIVDMATLALPIREKLHLLIIKDCALAASILEDVVMTSAGYAA
jgi:hypothetical protein